MVRRHYLTADGRFQLAAVAPTRILAIADVEVGETTNFLYYISYNATIWNLFVWTIFTIRYCKPKYFSDLTIIAIIAT